MDTERKTAEKRNEREQNCAIHTKKVTRGRERERERAREIRNGKPTHRHHFIV